MPDEAEIESIRTDFVVRFFGDLQRGAPRTAEEYYQLYPGFEELIAREWRRLHDAPDELQIHLDPTETAAATRSRSLGKYRIEREIGRGGQGTVYLAWDTTLDRRVALKVLKAGWTGSETMVRRFELEARALARLDPQGLASVHDAGEVHGLRYFAMRYVEGQTLAREIAARGRSPAGSSEILRYVTITAKAARAIDLAHEAGLVHRDIKPANLMITPENEPVVLDFGVARFCETDAPSLTLTGDLIGTPAFMAPEQFADKKGLVDRRTDVYGLAATLHEAVTSGGVQRDETASTMMGLPAAFRPRASARRLNADVPRDLQAVLDAALDAEPERRYATAAAFAEDLDRVRRGVPVAVRPRSRMSKLWLWCRRAPAAAALVFVTPVVLAAGLVALSLKNREVENAARDLVAKETEADAAALVARVRFQDFQRLDDLRRLQDLEDRERDLWPPDPDALDAMDRWIADAQDLAIRVAEHRGALATLRRRGRMITSREAGIDPSIDRKLHHEVFRDAAKAEALASATSPTRRIGLEMFIRDADVRIAALDAEIASRPRYAFDAVEDQWVHDNLATLVARFEALSGPSPHAHTIASMLRRVDLARALASASQTEQASAWEDAIRSIGNPATDPAYAGMKIAPILGLVPIGRDGRSRLWEFAVASSGTPPARDVDGRLVMTAESSIVLVLIPGGTFQMGARLPRADDEEGVGHADPAARRQEGPVHDVVLDPFFISKFEMTQGQWRRATGENPSHHHPDRHWDHGYRPDLRHPVERVSFEDCEDVLRRLGLRLPTEAQWECAARARTTTPWWHGPTIQSFSVDENLADATLVESERVTAVHDAERRDGWSGPAPVGTFPANPFGLHDTVGNVAEWCADGMDFYGAAVLPGDGLHCGETDGLRVVRGGSFNVPAVQARSSFRSGNYPASRGGTIGVRPACPLTEP